MKQTRIVDQLVLTCKMTETNAWILRQNAIDILQNFSETLIILYEALERDSLLSFCFEINVDKDAFT